MAEDGTADESEEAQVVPVVCTSCGEEDPSAFSRRMLNRRGRFGERTRLCRSCVGGQDASTLHTTGDTLAGTAGSATASSAGKLHGNDKKIAKLRTTLRRIQEFKQQRADGVRLDFAQAEQITREPEYLATLRALGSDFSMDGAQASSTQDVCGGAPLPADKAEREKRRQKVDKALRQINELKERRSKGQRLEKTQEEKIGRERVLRAELLQLGGCETVLPESIDEEGRHRSVKRGIDEVEAPRADVAVNDVKSSKGSLRKKRKVKRQSSSLP
eukprot:TRINITY_DN28187_c0_g1_i1.p1 TRINITY_DN28187_c0_g1~~TRINITY_DN28187_c0_g1_i1.p1  ORF type:complete len:273 (-),score=37.38 TRINITY_DN28187_c0_g1_i1:186-1004(-)